MRRLAWAALLGSMLLVIVVMASAFAGAGVACGATAGCPAQPFPSCTPSPEDVESGYYYGGYWNDTGSDCE